MSKLSLLIISTLIFVSGFSGIRSEELNIGFKIIKDTTDSSVDPGKCEVSGVALFEDKVVPNALVYAPNTRGVRTNKKGEFTIVLDTADQYLTIDMGDKKQGYIENYKFKEGHAITCEVYVRDWEMMMIVDKPVIYLYSEEKVEVEVRLRTEMELTFCYPVLTHDSWRMNVEATGVFDPDNGRQYPYLFWEATTDDLFYKQQDHEISGELISTDSIISYLETKLDAYGLNNTEKTDFITYWGPRMVRFKYVITQFNLDNRVDEMAALEVTPVPMNQRRVFMLFTGFNYQPEIELKAPDLLESPFNRNGFVLLEWGGTEISKEQLMKVL